MRQGRAGPSGQSRVWEATGGEGRAWLAPRVGAGGWPLERKTKKFEKRDCMFNRKDVWMGRVGGAAGRGRGGEGGEAGGSRPGQGV